MATSIELHELGAAREELMTRIKTALVEERERAAHSWTALAIESERQRKHLKLHTQDMDKNRYKDVLPYSESRVVLSNGRYINASELRDTTCGPSSSETSAPYIACQGPLKHTSEDFWDMVVEKGVSDVVMLTGLVENGREKCHDYIRVACVRCLQRSSVGGINVRELEVKRGSAVHRITHYQLMTWPDHGVPASPDVLDPLLDVLYQNAKLDRTTVVHCSAGIGRSGVLLALAMFSMRIRGMLSRGDVDVVGVLGDAGDGQGEGSVGVSNDDVRLCCSFVDIVGGMRRQRAGMVQTPLQLRFCIEAAKRLLELFSC
jgi:protein tyrosine phosphatase